MPDDTLALHSDKALTEFVQNHMNLGCIAWLPDLSGRERPSRWPGRASWPPCSSEQSGS